jgi:hypothetical protein
MTARRPSAFLSLWNGIASTALQAEYETWHTFEHVPERVGLPGFIEALRYRGWTPAADGTPRYFTCYWLDDLAALDSPAYRGVFAAPTPWSARMRTQLRDFFRRPCALAGSHGASSASQLCTLRLQGDDSALPDRLARLVDTAQVVSARWGQAAPTDFAVPIANSSAAADGEWVVMLQGIDRDALAVAAQGLAANSAMAEPPAYFELLSQVRQCDLAHSLGERQPAMLPLMHSFLSSTGDKP